MIISSTIPEISDRAYENAAKAFIRDPRRPIKVFNFLTPQEREILFYNVFGVEGYNRWLDENEHRMDTLIEDELSDSEQFVGKVIRRGLAKVIQEIIGRRFKLRFSNV